METRRRTWFDSRGLNVGGRHLPFYAGAMHYWRVPPAQWSACLRAMHSLGLTIVETYVPWRVHEPTAGQRVWTGEHDLSRFLEAARAAGLSVVLRPGPHVNAELTSFGIPDWVLADPACQARTAAGTPAWLPVPPRAFPIPSYASAKFRDRVAAWYATVAEVIQPHLAPDGPVVAIGIDNEAQLFFRSGAFDIDYHPDAIEWWHDASGLEEIPRAWDPDRAAACALWMKFKDEYIARALGEFGKLLDRAGLGDIARFHNLPPGHYQLYDLRRIQNAIAGPVGIDAYTPRAMFPELRRRAAALVGNAVPIPIAFEVGIGFFPWVPPLGSADDATRERDHLLTLLAAGTRGFNLFMAVDRDRYYGAAIDQRGHVEAHAAWIKPLIAALAEVDWPSLHRPAPIALVDMRADERFGIASSVLDPMTPVLGDMLDLGPGGATELGRDPGAIAARRWQTAIARALDLAQVSYVIVDEAATEEELARFRAVVAPTGERISRGLWHTLRAVAEHKRSVVVIGPGTPTRDELDQPLGEAVPKRIGRLKQGSLEDLAGLAEDLAQLVGDATERWRIERPADVRATPFSGADDRVRAVFVTSDSDRAVTAVLLPDPTVAALRDPFTGEHLHAVDGRVSIAMHARGVRLLIIEHVVAS
ncbi:MAG: glycoside hydrolase family 35 [Myxococcales bacterium]|nr:glycoside hydrolase family 35 [Myxococcales bacterium]